MGRPTGELLAVDSKNGNKNLAESGAAQVTLPEVLQMKNILQRFIKGALTESSIDKRLRIMNRIGGLAAAINLSGAGLGELLCICDLTNPNQIGLLNRFVDELRGCQTINSEFMASLTQYLSVLNSKDASPQPGEEN